MALFLLLQIFAIVYAGYISLWDWGLRGPRDFVGLENYIDLFTDNVFVGKAIPNTLHFAAVVVPAQIALGLSLAVIVNQKIRGQTFFRAAFYFPAIASSAAIVVLFTFLTQPDGLINTALGCDRHRHEHQLDERPAAPRCRRSSCCVVWTTSGTIMLFYLAALQTISNEVYEAAAIDGANWWSAFWSITFPLLKPAHFFASAVSVIGALQMFDQSFIAGGADGAPANALTTVVLYLYRATTRTFELGYAAAIGVVLLVAIMTLTLIQRRLFGQSEVA